MINICINEKYRQHYIEDATDYICADFPESRGGPAVMEVILDEYLDGDQYWITKDPILYLQVILIKHLETSHIRNILNSKKQFPYSTPGKIAFLKKELLKREQKQEAA